jgi:hypothetical protein
MADFQCISHADFRQAAYALAVMTMDQAHDFVALVDTKDCQSLSYTNDQSTALHSSTHPNNEHFQQTLH